MLKSSQSSSWNQVDEPLPPGGWNVIRCVAAVAFAEPARHRPHDVVVRGRLHRSVAAENPDDAGVLVASAQPLAVGLGVVGREDLGADAPFLVPLVAPRRQHADVEAQRVGALDDPVDVREVRLVRPRRIVAGERQLSLSVGVVQPVELREHYGLDDREARSARFFRYRSASSRFSRWNSSQAVSPSQKNGLPSAVTRNRLFSDTFSLGSGGLCKRCGRRRQQRNTGDCVDKCRDRARDSHGHVVSELHRWRRAPCRCG